METAQQNLLSVLKGKNILFLERSDELPTYLQTIQDFLVDNGVENDILADVSNVSFEAIAASINKADVIIFQTQWDNEVVRKLYPYAKTMTAKKIFIECYISQPHWYFKPKVIHDVYIIKIGMYDDLWKFYKLSSKPYWGYKNNFNK